LRAKNFKIQQAKKEPFDIPIDSTKTIFDLKIEIESKIKKLTPNRQKLALGLERDSVILSDDRQTLQSTFKDAKEALVYLKDLGPQISWQMVFVIEYLGPLLLYPLLALRLDILYGPGASKDKLNWVQLLALACWTGHYIKREVETLFVHRFSHETMPLANLWRNSGYYWLAGLLAGYFINHPLYTPPNDTQVFIGLTIFVISEIGNAICHLMLRNLRPAGSRDRKVPKGFLFDYVSFPNYTFEVLAWIGFSIMTKTAAAYFFTAIGFYMMYTWGKAKRSKYIKEFGSNFPKSRKVIIPFIL